MKLLIRADAGPGIGSGHVMRCLALAQAWQDAGGAASFLSAALPAALEERLEREQIARRQMTDVIGSVADAEQTIRVALEWGATWVVIDGYHFDTKFLAALQRGEMRSLIVDDLGRPGPFPGDVVLNQNPQASVALYPDGVTGRHLLLGLRYAMLRREFLASPKRARTSPDVRKVLVTLGGADPDNTTLKVIDALSRLSAADIEVVVVAGPANPHLAELQAAVASSNRPIDLQTNPPDMPALMDWADIAISAAGSTCWELAYMGLPSLLIVLAENQREGAEALHRKNVARNLGWHAALDAESISAEIGHILAANGARQEMSENGLALIDGGGARRVVESLLGRTLTLRLARQEDSDLLFAWANDPEVRLVSFSSEAITREGHERWFSEVLKDPRRRLYLAWDATGAPIGQLRFDCPADTATEATISVSIAPEKRGAGLGQQLIRQGVETVFRESEIQTIHAFAKPANVRSIAAFEAAGFTNCGSTAMKGHPAVHLRRQAEFNSSVAVAAAQP